MARSGNELRAGLERGKRKGFGGRKKNNWGGIRKTDKVNPNPQQVLTLAIVLLITLLCSGLGQVFIYYSYYLIL